MTGGEAAAGLPLGTVVSGSAARDTRDLIDDHGTL
jgi:hypothetical protein